MDKPIRKKKPAKRAPLSATRIAEAALALIDREGLEGFSYRILARELACEAMSLYHYYPSKAHLYDAILDICLGEVEIPPPSVPWLERLRVYCHNIRNLALRHPGFFLYCAIHRLNNRQGLAFLNEVLSIFDHSGLSTELRARHFRAIGYYVMGAGLDESMGYIKGPTAVEPVSPEEARRDFPAITAVGAWFGREHHEATFSFGLETLLARLAADAEAHGGR